MGKLKRASVLLAGHNDSVSDSVCGLLSADQYSIINIRHPTIHTLPPRAIPSDDHIPHGGNNTKNTYGESCQFPESALKRVLAVSGAFDHNGPHLPQRRDRTLLFDNSEFQLDL